MGTALQTHATTYTEMRYPAESALGKKTVLPRVTHSTEVMGRGIICLHIYSYTYHGERQTERQTETEGKRERENKTGRERERVSLSGCRFQG